MSLSLWIDPATSTTNPYDYGTLVGKGSIDSSGNENDNYQLVQMGNQIYFEWGDLATGQHYNIETTSGPVSTSEWNYIAVTTTSSGAPEIYVNGVPQAYTLQNSNVVGTDTIGSCTDPPACTTLYTSDPSFSGVNLANVNNGITIGEQNSAAYPFYYTGGMSAVTFYNQALTQSAVTNNLDNYLT
jgi:hypothetical protein